MGVSYVFAVPEFFVMPDLSIAIDVGGSSTKIIYQSAAMAQPRCWYMPPEVEPISAAQLERFFELQAGMGNLNPSLHAWVKLDDQLWVVGKMAHHFMPDDRIHEKKYENALYKVLAIVGVLLEVQRLQKSRALTLRLAMVLPMDEFGDRKRLQSELERLLKGFDCRGQRYKVKLEQFLCRPEGAGLMAFYLQKFPKQFAANSVGFLMLGHRNVTGLGNFRLR
jgi:Actin like proteins N terminal domain